ncbi:unnamed protein product [Acanthoscelides obtectus]|uniref:Transmembrane protein 186 n=1 Tax=Acanthoscelides obtectus TaxID=200917 RepID=A0A9P0PHZ0_ACAOB|nr:unnamed protein product [Acanthoscelides obtectus]CAK1638335.1 Transmembrane protein 186 [Acanthoscelides obtectus]
MLSLVKCCLQPKSLTAVKKLEFQKCCSIHTGIRLLSANNIQHPDKDFVPVYKFPYVRPLAVVNKLALYQTVLTATSIPVALLLKYTGIIGAPEVQLIAALGLTACTTLLTAGYFTQKFIGFIYYNEEKNIVRIAYNDFWGRRKDLDIPASDIVPLSDLPATPLDRLYLTFRRFSTKDSFKFNMNAAIILDKEKFKKVF